MRFHWVTSGACKLLSAENTWPNGPSRGQTRWIQLGNRQGEGNVRNRADIAVGSAVECFPGDTIAEIVEHPDARADHHLVTRPLIHVVGDAETGSYVKPRGLIERLVLRDAGNRVGGKGERLPDPDAQSAPDSDPNAGRT